MMFNGFGGPGFGIGSGMFAMMAVMMIIKFAIIVGIIVFGVKFAKNYLANSSGALKILDEKFAKGEISEEEYLKKRNIIKNNR